MADWRECEGPERWGYADWEALQATGDARAEIVPAFLRLAPEGGMDAAQVLEAMTELGRLGGRLSAQEADRLASALPLGTARIAELRLVAHVPRRSLGALDRIATVDHVGPPLPLTEAPGAGPPLPGEDLRREPVAGSPAQRPVLGVIDDGIPFLHARLRRGWTGSRVEAVWLQADARAPVAGGPGPVRIGRELERLQIEGMLASGMDEADLYRRLHQSLLPVTQRAGTRHRVSHGAQVLDMAGGADPLAAQDAALRGVDVLAVQLPPAAVADTSGRRLDPFVVMGLRWIVTRALRLCRERGGPVPVVVNISLGSLGGSGTADAFLADWIGHEIDRYRALSGAGPDDPGLRVVLPYGNSRRERLVARGTATGSAPLVLDWRLLPDDHSPSFLELRAPGGVSGLSLRLVPPDSRVPVLDLIWSKAARGWRLDGPDGRPRAAVLPLPDGGPPALLVALAPSERADGGPVAPAGRWRVELHATGAARPVVAQVQRDDTPSGYRRLGRQPWLDHPADWAWDVETGGFLAPGAGPVTRAASAAAHAGLVRPEVLHVGALTQGPGLPASPYSAEGGTPGSAGPSLAAVADDGRAKPGRLTAGVAGRSVTRLSGTSVAAPAVARALLTRLLAGEGIGLSDLVGHAPKPVPDAQRGQGPLTRQAEPRPART